MQDDEITTAPVDDAEAGATAAAEADQDDAEDTGEIDGE